MPTGRPRVKTANLAECCKCGQMLPHAAFNKGQASCAACQAMRRRDRYSKGRRCSLCEATPISDYAPREHCRKCAHKIRSEATAPRREVNPKRYVILTSHHAHPNADARGRIYEHVKVMSEKLGRPLVHGVPAEGVRDDNRPENLELWVTSQPKGQRPADLIEWAHEILRRYET